MIIQCEQCSTKFRLDDAKVTDKGVKVRCAKCRHVFTVTKEPVETDAQPDLDDMLSPSQPDFGAMLDQSAAATPPVSFDLHTDAPVPIPAAEPGFDYSDFVANDEAAFTGAPGDPFTFSAPEEKPNLDSEHHAPQASEVGADFGDLFLDTGAVASGKPAAVGPAEFDFGDIPLDTPSTTAPTGGTGDTPAFSFDDSAMGSSWAPEPPPGAGDSAPFDFGGETGFGDVPAAPPNENAAEPFSPDSGTGGFPDVTDKVAVEASPPPADGSATEESFTLDEFEFGDEPADQPAQQEPREQPVPDAVKEETAQSAEDELPPLSIASRRRQSPLFGVLIAVVTVVVVAVLGYFGYTMFLEDKAKVVPTVDRITVRGVNASFVKNPAIGELLVITGEAVNSFSKPRAAIQVKGTVYGAKGQVMASKNAYCGNPLTPVQLATLSQDKIDAAMANQFGDSLANMEVAPGKAIPFVIVIPKPPADAKDYGVEPAGSTVAAGKP